MIQLDSLFKKLMTAKNPQPRILKKCFEHFCGIRSTVESVKRRFEKVYCLCNNDGRPARSVARKRLYCKRRQVKNVLRRTLDLWLADNLSSLTFRRDWPIGFMMWSMQLFSGRRWTNGMGPKVKEVWNVSMHVQHSFFLGGGSSYTQQLTTWADRVFISFY